MQKKLKIFLIIIFFIFSITYTKHVTYDSNNLSQLGDRLLEYSITKWISWKYKIPFLYQSFPNSNSFLFHEKEYSDSNESLLKTYKNNRIRLQYFSHDSFNNEALYGVRLNYSHDIEWNDYNSLIDKITITQSPFIKTTKEGKELGGYFDYLFIASRKNPEFLNELKKLIFPQQKITYFNLPKNKISVAIHIRCGGKFEKYPQYFPSISIKMPPINFYTDQLKRLSTFLNNTPLFVYIFTNHSNPLDLVHEIKNNLTQFNNITFASRNKNEQDNTLIEDLFFMSKFDCLIRPCSSFSMVAQLIGNHKITLYPKRGFWKNKKLYFDKIGMMILDQNLNFIPPYLTSSQKQSFIQKLKKY